MAQTCVSSDIDIALTELPTSTVNGEIKQVILAKKTDATEIDQVVDMIAQIEQKNVVAANSVNLLLQKIVWHSLLSLS
ncbi:hypothetical protein B9G39_17820 [Zooshikella ganghwensis]|uniref:Uncharacterized protein n=1 Tax=Zooshikella ganghwensis TaxID=202772 RepID=A0A4P9VNV7_9GAMM|nr:hypothetical protein B9G39_17820 [Zooshikella ganghwensis]